MPARGSVRSRSAALPRSSNRRARSTAPTPAASRSPCSTARSSRSTARTAIPVTDGFICAKVRKFGDRVYGPDRLLLPGHPQGPQGRRPVRARDVGRGAGARRRAHARREGRVWRRVDPALLVRRIERPADAGQPGRDAVAPVRHVASGAHALRGADRRGQHGALRQDAVGHLSGLSRGAADRPLGRQPVDLRHSSRPVRARGAGSAARSSIVVDPRSTPLARVGRRAPAGAARHRRRGRAGDPSVSVRARVRRRGVSRGAHARRRAAARARRALDDRQGRGGRRHRRRPCSRAPPSCTRAARRR